MNKAVKRGLLMIAGILSVLVIVLTQSFYQPTETNQKKIASEKTTEKSAQDVSISAPSDVVPHGNTVAVSENAATIASRAVEIEHPKKITLVAKNIFVIFFKALFSVVIAPNAP
jgi:hypothetical protein